MGNILKKDDLKSDDELSLNDINLHFNAFGEDIKQIIGSNSVQNLSADQISAIIALIKDKKEVYERKNIENLKSLKAQQSSDSVDVSFELVEWLVPGIKRQLPRILKNVTKKVDKNVFQIYDHNRIFSVSVAKLQDHSFTHFAVRDVVDPATGNETPFGIGK